MLLSSNRYLSKLFMDWFCIFDKNVLNFDDGRFQNVDSVETCLYGFEYS